MNRRPIIPVRSFKTDDYRTSLAIGPKDTLGRSGQRERYYPFEQDRNREEEREKEREELRKVRKALGFNCEIVTAKVAVRVAEMLARGT